MIHRAVAEIIVEMPPSAPAASGASQSLHSAAAPHTFPWLSTGIRLFVLLVVAGLVAAVAHDWGWWMGSTVQQATDDDTYLEAGMTPLAAKVPGHVRPMGAMVSSSVSVLVNNASNGDFRCVEPSEAA
jgi:hypothetical protein